MAFTSWGNNIGLGPADATASADPDSDGIANALEYVLGGEPAPGIADSNSTELLPTSSPSNGDLVFRFKRKDASEEAVDLNFEWSTDLSFTTAKGVTIGAVSATNSDGIVIDITEDTPDEATDDIVVTVPASEATSGKLFARLRAIVPQ